MNIKGKHFLITGANRGIGLAVAKMAARSGASLHLVSRQSLIESSEFLNMGALDVKNYTADLSTREGVDRLIHSLENQQIDIVFNNAGLLTGGLIEEQSIDEIYSLFQVNLTSVIHLTRALIPSMVARGSGKIINNASVSAFMHFPCASTYAASKAALVAFTNCIHLELLGTGVSTLCLITPGIQTRMFTEIENKYSKHFEIPKNSISPENFAEEIKRKILSDEPYLYPSGLTSLGLFISKSLPWLFKKMAQKKFKRIKSH